LSPLPYIRSQVIALGLLIVLGGAFDAATLAVSIGFASLLWLLAMHLKYLGDLKKTQAAVPPHRAALDRVVTRDPLFTIVPATLLAALFLFGQIQPVVDEVAVHGAASALMPAAMVIWGSSLVDWYVILPRISGQLGSRPCRSAVESPEFPFPGTWKEVTRWWYVHRIVAALAFRVGLSTALAVVIGDISGLHEEARWFAGVAMLLFSGYAISTLARGTRQVGHAKGIVSETVRVAHRPPKRRKWLPLLKLEPLELDGRFFVVDIAIESVQLIAAETYESATLPRPDKFARHPDEVPLENIKAIRQEPRKFSGCEGRCSGVNWYCIENPRCFDPK
jgi:hypothetical protein